MRDKKDVKSAQNDIIVGRNAVSEALRSGREIDKLLVAHGAAGGTIVPIIAKCRERNILIKEVSPAKLDFMCGGTQHQGVAAVIAGYAYSKISDMLALAESRGEKPFLIICDEIADPHNLGAIIRSAEAGGAHGVIIPKHRSASLNFTVAKTASGALEYLPVARVTNIANTIEELQKAGLWVFAADMDGESYCEVDYSMPVAIVIGSEGQGVGRLTKQRCDRVISLPMRGKINSLNASVAAGILIYEVVRSRAKNTVL